MFVESTQYDVLLVIPTVATPEVLVPSFGLLCRRLDGLRVHVVLSVNPLKPEHGEHSIQECQRLWAAHLWENRDSRLTIHNERRPCGFGGAINRGIQAALKVDPGIPALTVIWNDDLRVTEGWLTGMFRALQSPTVEEWSEVPNEKGHRPLRPMGEYLNHGKIGLIGPMTNCAAGIQNIPREAMEAFEELGVERFAVEWREQHRDRVLTADFLSGYCMGITLEAMNRLSHWNEAGFAWLFDERYTIAGYEDNDLCARAAMAGFRQVIAAEVFIGHLGHQTFDAAFPHMGRGMRNRLTYYDCWRAQRDFHPPRITGVYRIRLEVLSDIDYLRMSLVRHGSLLDAAVVLLTANPGIVLQSREVLALGAQVAAKLHPRDLAMLQRCAAGSAGQVVEAFQEWVKFWLDTDLPNAPSRKPAVMVAQWTGEFHEQRERNALLDLAMEQTDCTWILSIDHDESLEPRITRQHLERLMRHPDPLVACWDLAFLNHWENNRMYRVDRPWGDGGTWTGGMRGYRFFRVNRANPRRILAGGHNGLHCGNVPGSDWSTKRVAGFAFRHFGYMHYADRLRKEARYNQQDPNPDPVLVGGTSYAHISDDAPLTLMPFVAESGIGLHMLMYSGEKADDLGRILDQVYGLVDKIVLVWTEETPLDPTCEIARMAAHFGAEWIHHPLREDLASARNAGIEALHGTPGLGWSWFMDPDEHLPEMGPIFLRRMAQSSDNWAWLFSFANHMNEKVNLSESVRMARLDPNKIMRLSGRVHETFEAALRILREKGIAKTLRSAPPALTCQNLGLSGTASEQQAKLERYREMTELELRDHPDNAGAWVTLGLYWANMQEERMAEECFSRAVVVEKGQYLPYQELALLKLRQGRRLLVEAVSRMGRHRMRAPWEKLIDILDNEALVMPLMGASTEPGYTSPLDGMSEMEKMNLLPPLNLETIPEQEADRNDFN